MRVQSFGAVVRSVRCPVFAQGYGVAMDEGKDAGTRVRTVKKIKNARV